MKKDLNDKVTCSVNSNLEIFDFTWKLTDDNRELIVSSNQTHELNASGLHRCEVKYSIRNLNCFDVVSLFYVSETSKLSVYKSVKHNILSKHLGALRPNVHDF